METELRLYDTSGSRQPLPDRFIAGWEFELLPRGGYGTFSLRLLAEIDESEISLPSAEWTWEVWFGAKRAYRGRVERVRPAISDTKGRTVYPVEGVGRMGRVQTLLADCQYTRPGGSDVADVYAWLAAKFLAGAERLGEFAQAIESPIGYTLEHVDLFGSTVRQAFDKLAEAAQDLLIWGFDVSPEGADRLYVRTRPTSVTHDDFVFWVGKDVTFLELPEDISELVNSIRLVGGKSKAPNLVYNPSFELPFNPGEGPEGSLLENGSFDSPGAGWVYNPSEASIRQASDGEPGEYSRTGSKFAELDNPNDWVRQTVDLAAAGAPTGAGNRFTLQLWHAIQNGTLGTIHVTVWERNGSGNLGTLLDEDIDATARSYQEFKRTLTTKFAGTTHLRVQLEYVSGNSVLLDDVYLYDANELISDGWNLEARGSAVGEVDWASEGPPDAAPFHGCYCVRVDTTGTDGSASDCVRLHPTKDKWSQTRDKTQHVVKVRVWGAAGLTVRLGLQRHGDGGGADYVFGSAETLLGTGWETLTATLSSAGKSEIRPIVELRSDGNYYVDAVEVYESGVENRDVFLDGENLVLSFRTDNGGSAVPLDLAQLSPAAATSIATYGLREAVVEVEEIQDLARAKDYAIGYFNRQAIPQKRGRLTLEPCDVHVRFVDDDPDATPLGQIRVGGLDVAVPDQNAARILYSMEADGALRCEIDLTTMRPEVGLLLAQALGKERSSSSGGGGAGTNLSNGSGGGSSAGENGTAPSWKVNDALVGSRSALNLKAGTGISAAGVDDEAGDEAEVTFAAKPDEVHLLGVHADRPGVTTVLPGTYWTSTDQADGTTYRSDGTAWVQIAGPVTPGGGAGGAGYTRYDGWRRTDIGVNASTSYTQMNGYDGLDLPDPMPYAGTLWAVAVALDAALPAGQIYDVQLYRSTDGGATWNATGLVATVDGSAGSAYGRRFATAEDSTGIAFGADDLFAIYDRKTAGIGARSCRAHYLVTF